MAKDHGTEPTDLGKNRTGMQTSPRLGKAMMENTEAVPAAPQEATAAGLVRSELATEAPPIGTMPVPGNIKGIAKTALKAMQGEKATVFLDKLGERLAFERGGVRLYDAVLSKLPASATQEGSLTAAEVKHLRDEELSHFLLVKEAMEQMGGDPTAETPCADLVGVQSSGLMQVVTDARTTLSQCLDAVLAAELIDNDGWKMLIAMAEAAGQQELAQRFTEALAEEDDHLQKVRTWITERLSVQLGTRVPAPEFGEPRAPA
jgi:hypothetical protein